nr:reverse transcriptase domain-containing protein [Tanacetum cinerariifolium]
MFKSCVQKKQIRRHPKVVIKLSLFNLRATVAKVKNSHFEENPTPKGRIHRSSKQKVKNSHFEENLTPVDTMIDNRTMAEMLRAPTEGCAEAIVVPPILAEQFELKHSLINMMTSEQFFGLKKDNPHDHVRAARRWLKKEPLRSITTCVRTPTMTDNRTMAEMLRAPTEGCAEAIIVPPILAEQFELKHSLINMMTSEQFFGFEKDNSHDHVRWFNKITSTIKYKDVPNSVIKLILFPFSLAGAARRWLEKEPPRSITTWDDLVSKFINEFFPPSRTANLRNEISNFQQKFDESFHEACERYKDLLRACPHHCFTELHQLDTFYNALNPADQDSLNAECCCRWQLIRKKSSRCVNDH